MTIRVAFNQKKKRDTQHTADTLITMHIWRIRLLECLSIPTSKHFLTSHDILYYGPVRPIPRAQQLPLFQSLYSFPPKRGSLYSYNMD